MTATAARRQAVVLSSIVEQLVSTSQPRERITRALISLRSLVTYTRCAVLDPRLTGGEILVLPSSETGTDEDAETAADQEPLRRLVARLLQRVVGNADADAPQNGVSLGGPDHGHLALPLHGGDRAYGVLFVERATKDAWDDEALAQLRVVAASLGSYLTSQHDAAERAKFEELLRALRREEALAMERVTEVVEATVGDAFFSVDSTWIIELVNSTFERVSGTRRHEAVGRLLWEVLPESTAPGAKNPSEYHRCMTERVTVEFVEHFAPLDRWTEVRAFPRVDGGIGVFFRDVSVERRAVDVQKLQADFEKHLLGIVSHDLGNPLSAIQMGAQVLAQYELDGRAAKIVLRIQSAVERANRMVRDLLDFTQARLGGGLRVTRTAVDLREVVSSVLDEVEAARPGREVRVEHKGDVRGAWDRDRVAQVLQNLVTNALKYSPEDTTVFVRTKGQDRTVELSVHNRGAPIPPELVGGLFEPMQRATLMEDRTARSVGLGLYIVKSIVDAHAGSIDVTTNEEQGTTFTVRLPRETLAPVIR